MRIRVFLSLFVLTCALAACNLITGVSSLNFGEGSGGDAGGSDGAMNPISDDGASATDSAGNDGTVVPTPDGGPVPPSGSQLANSATLVLEGITDNGYIIYGDTSTNTLYAISSAATGSTAPTSLGTADLSVVLVGHNVVSFYPHATNRVGPLSIWTSTMTTPRQIATSSLQSDLSFGEYTVTVSADSAYILYYDGVDPTASSGNLFLAAVNAAGSGTELVGPIDVSEDNCHPELRFSAPYAVASYCTVTGPGGKIPDAGSNYDIATISSWLMTSPSQRTVATSVQTVFDSYEKGGMVVTFGASGIESTTPAGGGALLTLDTTGDDFFLADAGAAIVYTTSQKVLKRSSTSAASATQLVPAGAFTGLDALSFNNEWVIGYLNSATSGGTSDLYAASALSPGTALTLTSATTGSAGASGDAFTADSTYALYQTGYASNVGTLNAYPLRSGGGTATTLAQASYVAWGTTGTIVVFNANYASSKADIQWQDVAKSGPPATLVSGADPLFFVTPAKDKIVYTWSGSGSSAGLWVMNAPGATPTMPTSCIDAGFTGLRGASGAKGSCTATSAQTFYDDCLAPTATMTTCNNIAATIGTPCFDCLYSNSTSSTWGVLLSIGNEVFVNLGGCFEAESATEDACAAAFQAESQCQIDECGALDAGVTTCASGALTGACSCYVTATNTACAPFSSSACTFTSSDTFEQLYNGVAAVMCE